MSNLPLHGKALFLQAQEGDFVLGTNQVLQPCRGQLLLKVKATALNPVDWKIQKYGAFVEEFPAVLGMDLAGDVVAVGEGITKFKIGDPVFCQGRLTNDYASFQEYTLADEYHLAKIPPNINYDQAATIPVGLATAYIALYNLHPYGIALVSPLETSGQGYYKGEPFVVLGGAGSVGQFAIQLAKLSGFSPIIVTASLKHTNFLKSLGATHVLDRNLPIPNLKSEIQKITNKPIIHVYDAIAVSETQRAGKEIIAPGGHLMLVHSPVITTDDINIPDFLAIRQLEQNVEVLTGLYEKLTEWLENGVIKPNRVELLPGGLNGIVAGLQNLEGHKVSGVKLVVRPEDTLDEN